MTDAPDLERDDATSPQPGADDPGPIHAAALPNALTADELRLRSDARGAVTVDPARAGWRYLSFRALRLGDGERLDVGGPDRETAVVLVAGGGATIEGAGRSTWSLAGRADSFADLASGWYLPPGRAAVVVGRPSAADGSTLIAVASAPMSGRAGVAQAPFAFEPADIRTEIRGAGNATRQICHLIEPGSPADRLELVEVLTPSGNWSSWPPHKHDVDAMPGEAVLEEIYYYRFRRPGAWGLQRLYRPDRSRDAMWEVRDGDVVLVTDGYHPFSATHGDDAWYLNALAGDRRTMACSFDPELDHVRAAWATMAVDPRVPLVPPAG